jgi:hypothetical protein
MENYPNLNMEECLLAGLCEIVLTLNTTVVLSMTKLKDLNITPFQVKTALDDMVASIIF